MTQTQVFCLVVGILILIKKSSFLIWKNLNVWPEWFQICYFLQKQNMAYTYKPATGQPVQEISALFDFYDAIAAEKGMFLEQSGQGYVKAIRQCYVVL